MKKLLMAGVVFASFSPLAFSRSDVLKPDEVNCSAMSVDREGTVLHLRGQARIETASVSIRADQADFNSQTQQVSASGNVQITLK